ncbi:hypothetical protein Dimus_003346 [Dionaea muscipula]
MDLHENFSNVNSFVSLVRRNGLSFVDQTLGCFFEYTRCWFSISRLRIAASSWIQTVKEPCINHALDMEVATGHGKRWLQMRQMWLHGKQLMVKALLTDSQQLHATGFLL